MTYQDNMEEQASEDVKEEPAEECECQNEDTEQSGEDCEIQDESLNADDTEPEATEKSQTEQLEEKITTLNNQLLRTMAEYDNFRKRSQREKDSIYPQATASTVAQFIPVLDTFERALDAPCSDEEFKKGIVMIKQNFLDILGKLGVESFGEAGEEFSPDLHEAVMHIEDEELASNVVAEVFQKGYKIGDRVVRHAVVKVAN